MQTSQAHSKLKTALRSKNWKIWSINRKFRFWLFPKLNFRNKYLKLNLKWEMPLTVTYLWSKNLIYPIRFTETTPFQNLEISLKIHLKKIRKAHEMLANRNFSFRFNRFSEKWVLSLLIVPIKFKQLRNDQCKLLKLTVNSKQHSDPKIEKFEA